VKNSLERVLYNAEIRNELNVNQRTAKDFLIKFGVRMGGWYAIDQGTFRFLQLTGEVEKWMSGVERNKRKKEKMNGTD